MFNSWLLSPKEKDNKERGAGSVEREAWVGQWRDHSPHTNVARVQIPGSTPNVELRENFPDLLRETLLNSHTH